MKSFKELKKLAKEKIDGIPQIKIAILGDSATQLLVTAIKGTAIEKRLNIDIWESEYNQIERQLFDPSSDYHNLDLDFTIIFQSSHKLLEQYSLLSWDKRESMWSERLDSIKEISKCCKGKIIYFNYPEIDDSIFGNFSNKIKYSFIYQIRKLNVELMNHASEFSDFHICDIDAIQAKIGRDKMFAPSIYAGTDMVLSLDTLPIIASRIIDIISASRGKFKKCVICDLDNTLWGGIVGDDGWENLQIGHGLGIGKIYSEFQEWLKKLKERGIILAVCSKNTESIAKEAFEKHPDMVLRLDDFAVFVANWNNKVENIRMIQETLNIGMDSIVFLDDNPFERNMVRQAIPEITVPELPQDPADYLEFLYNENLFETTSFSNEDSDRTRQYKAEYERKSAQLKFENEEDYLKSLDMVAKVEGFTKFNTPRVAQLSQRSNQFNLRTIRYSEDDIHSIEENTSKFKTFSFSLSDKFGDNGLISVVILEKKDDEILFIDTWFMSCRVLKRGMEKFVLNTIMDYANKNGYKTVIGEYLPTAKNGLVKDHYVNLGFKKIEGQDNLFQLKTNEFKKFDCQIKAI